MDDCIGRLLEKLTPLFKMPTSKLPTLVVFESRLDYPILHRDAYTIAYNIGTLSSHAIAVIALVVHRHSLSIQFPANLNNASLTWQPSRGMYIVGLKMNDPFPRVKGKTALHYLAQIARTLRIRTLFAHDAASSNAVCYFSIVRMLANKEGYYASCGWRHLNPDKAQETIDGLKRTLSKEEIATCCAFVETREESLVPRVNVIVERAMKLVQHQYLTEYVIDL